MASCRTQESKKKARRSINCMFEVLALDVCSALIAVQKLCENPPASDNEPLKFLCVFTSKLYLQIDLCPILMFKSFRAQSFCLTML